jgi:hypothetical protein
MSGKNLTVYLASIGQPEVEKAKEREAELVKQEMALAPATTEPPKGKEIKPPPEFTPRHKISSLFSEFATEFTKNARDKGVELHWIGVGTWKTPLDIVPAKHLEAWKLSRENLLKGSSEAISKLENETILRGLMSLIQDVPITSFNNKVPEIDDKKNAMRILLLDYRQQLVEVAELMKARGETVSDYVIRAIEFLSDVLGFSEWHWIGSKQRSEDSLYQELIQLVGGDSATADRLIELERIQFPSESRLQLIERAIEHLKHDRR